jgi:Flp pilus assembly protein TadG
MMAPHASRLTSVVLPGLTAPWQGARLRRVWQRVKGAGRTSRARCSGFLKQLCGDRSGASAVVIALAMTGVLGLAGLGTEVGMWYVSKRTMQAASDSAAYSAAMAEYNGETKAQYTREAKSVAGSYNFVDDTNNTTVTVNSPPTKGNYTTDSNAVEVIITQQQPIVVSGLFLGGPTTVATRSVALTGTPGAGCVLALDGASIDDIFNNGNTTINLIGCDLYDNSPNNCALNLVGSANLTANGAFIVGNYCTSNNASLTITPRPTGDGTHVNWSAPISDPYASYLASYSAPTTCNYNNQKYNAGANIPASTFTNGQVFCGGLDITGNSTVNFPSGIFYITNGVLHVDGGSTLNAPVPACASPQPTGCGTTFVLSGTATVNFEGGATINVTALNSGPFPGVAFAVTSPSGSGTSSFQGGATMNVQGAVYSPNNTVQWAGGSNTTGTPCTQIVALTIDFKGNSVFGDNCTGYGFPNASIGKLATKLVE